MKAKKDTKPRRPAGLPEQAGLPGRGASKVTPEGYFVAVADQDPMAMGLERVRAAMGSLFQDRKHDRLERLLEKFDPKYEALVAAALESTNEKTQRAAIKSYMGLRELHLRREEAVLGYAQEAVRSQADVEIARLQAAVDAREETGGLTVAQQLAAKEQGGTR